MTYGHRVTSLTIDIADVARWLAGENSEVQAEFFNAFAQQLFELCRNDSGVQSQMHYIVTDMHERQAERLGWKR